MKHDRPLRLLDMSIRWPPDYQPFIAGRLRSLAAHGVKIYVTTSSHHHIDSELMPYATVVRLPSANERPGSVAFRTMVSTARILAKRPLLTLRGMAAGIAKSASISEFALWWANAAPLLDQRIDVVHFEWNGLAATFGWLPELLDAPFVVSCRGRQVNIQPHIPGEDSARQDLARSFTQATLVHGVCAEILREASKLGMARDKGRVVYTSVDLDFFRPSPQNIHHKARIRLLSVGVCMWRKGYAYLLLALRKVLDSGIDASLEIADFGGPEQDRMHAMICDLGLTERVKLLGTLSPALVREALWRCDIFVLPALSEGISNAVIEAMASGVPVITTVCGGMQEAVTDGIEGRLVPVRDVNRLAESIIELGVDPELRARMGAAGRKRAERDFRPDLQAKQFRELYDEAVVFHQQRTTGSRREKMSIQSTSAADARQTSERISHDNIGPAHNGVHIVTVAELHWRNGHEYALEAVKLLKDRGFSIKYTIVGKGPFLEAVGFARYQLGLMDEVQLITDDTRGDESLLKADLFLLASVAEGATNALAAAVSNGIPVVCTNLDSFISATDGYSQRRIVGRRAPEAIAAAVADLLYHDRDSGNGRSSSHGAVDVGHSTAAGQTLGST